MKRGTALQLRGSSRERRFKIHTNRTCFTFISLTLCLTLLPPNPPTGQSRPRCGSHPIPDAARVRPCRLQAGSFRGTAGNFISQEVRGLPELWSLKFSSRCPVRLGDEGCGGGGGKAAGSNE